MELQTRRKRLGNGVADLMVVNSTLPKRQVAQMDAISHNRSAVIRCALELYFAKLQEEKSSELQRQQ
jgi:hypothetical protein